MTTEIKINEDDLAEIVTTQMNQVTSLQLQVAALKRTLSERDDIISKLENGKNNNNGSVDLNA